MSSGNGNVSVAVEFYLAGSADKSKAALIEDALFDAFGPVGFSCQALKSALRCIETADLLIRYKQYAVRHLQRDIHFVGYKSRLIERMDLESAALD